MTFCSNAYQLNQELPEFLKQKSVDGEMKRIVEHKTRWRNKDWQNMIEDHREYELANMRQNFESEAFLNAMSDFVFKRKTV